MKRFFTIALFALSACGGFENEPLKTGVIRGQLAGTDAHALVAVVGRDDLVAVPAADGRFELTGVPLGPADLLVVINLRESRRLAVQVEAATVVDVGAVAPQPSGHLELHLESDAALELSHGTVTLVGTPFKTAVRAVEFEAEFTVPAGCYDAHVVVPGVDDRVVSQLCVAAGGFVEQHVELAFPDGSAGHEGCAVSGCRSTLLTCQADRTCR